MFLFIFFSVSSVFSESPDVDFLLKSERVWLIDNLDDIELWYSPEFPPLEYTDSQGSFVGMGADIILPAEEKLGVSLKRDCVPTGMNIFLPCETVPVQ